MMNVYAQIAVKIIESQEAIIGPVAVEQAKRVPGLKIDWEAHEASISGDEAKVIDLLVGQYKELFGQISVEVSREAASGLISRLPTDDFPQTLK